MKAFPAIAAAAFIIGVCIPWPLNAYKLSQCDFEADYKCEVLHTIGVFVPPAALITVWFGTDQ